MIFITMQALETHFFFEKSFQTRQKFIAITGPHGNLVAHHRNVALVQVLNVLERDDIRLVDTHKSLLGQHLLQVLQGKKGRDAPLRGVESDVFMLPLDESRSS